MIFVGCYTLNTPYEQEAAKLQASLEHHGLRYDIQGYESRGSWLANCHYIPIFCRAMLEKYPHESVVYLDADAKVERFPALLFQIEAEGRDDFAVYHLPREKRWNELLDGTMYFRNTPASRKLVDDWIAQDAREFLNGKWEQKVLEELLPRAKIKWRALPCEYCFIFDNKIQMRQSTDDPVIVHYQASRRLRKDQPILANTAAFLMKLPRPFAVVGNGDSFRRGDGQKIDAHPTVIRLNNFVIEGFEGLVGTKLSAWAVNACADVPYREFGVPVFSVFGERDIYSIAPWTKGPKRVPHLLLPSHSWGRATQAKYPKQRNPSTGLTLLHMLDTLGIETRAFGFDAFRSGHYWEPELVLADVLSHCTHVDKETLLSPEREVYRTFKSVEVL